MVFSVPSAQESKLSLCSQAQEITEMITEVLQFSNQQPTENVAMKQMTQKNNVTNSALRFCKKKFSP